MADTANRVDPNAPISTLPIRAYMAMMLAAADIEAGTSPKHHIVRKEVADRAVEMADVLISALNNTEQKGAGMSKTPSQILKEARAKIGTHALYECGCAFCCLKDVMGGHGAAAGSEPHRLMNKVCDGGTPCYVRGDKAKAAFDKAIELAEQEEKGAGTNG